MTDDERARAAEPISRVPPDAEVPASFGQRRLWMGEQLRPTDGPCAYNQAVLFELHGAVDARALAQSLQDLVARHEAWRTSFVDVDGELRQRVQPEVLLPFNVRDLSSFGPIVARRKLDELIRKEAQRPFELAAGPLVRPFLVRLSLADYALFLSAHQLVVDSWTLALFQRELAVAYEARLAGRTPSLPPLPVQYRDFAAWQERRRASILEAQLPYWTRALWGAPRLALPTDRPRPPSLSSRGAHTRLRVSPAVTQALATLAQAEGAPLSTVLLAAYALLLGRWAREDDVVIGLALSARTRPELEAPFGWLAATLPARLDLRGRPSFRALLRRALAVWRGAHEHLEVPLERVVAALDEEREPSRNPLFQTLFELDDAPSVPAQLGEAQLRRERPDNGVAQLELSLRLEPRDGGLAGVLQYATELFDATTIDALAARFGTLLESIVADPDRAIAQLALVSPDERRALIHAGTARGKFASAASLPARFVEQARRTPDQPAVTAGEQTLTYNQLDRRSDALAARLQRAGVVLESRVGLYLDRSVELVVAALGILKAGGAYVPIEPGTPPERLRLLLDDAGAQVVVSDAQHRGELDRTVVTLDELHVEPATFAPPALSARHLACVIDTAASIDGAKGVLVEHGAIARLVDAGVQVLGLDDRDTWALAHSIVHDVSVWELWAALLTGARLAIVPQEIAGSPEELHALLAKERVTVLGQTSAAFARLSKVAVVAPPLPSLRLVLLAGDALDPRQLEPWLAHHGDERPALHHLYGFTESAVHTLARRVRASELLRAARGLGAPLPDLALHVLDDELEPLPVGAPGELYVGGPGLARGYVGRPADTALRFVPDPFSSEAGARLYRTGDLARRLPDGELESLCRADPPGERRGQRARPARRRDDELASHPRAPATPEEEALVGVWATLLGVDSVGLDDSFFELGGDSLSAMRLVARLGSHLGVRYPLRSFFAAPTVRALLTELPRLRATEGAVADDEVVAAPVDDAVPLSFEQARLWRLEQLRVDGAPCPGNQAHGLQLDGALDVGALQRSLDELVRRHDAWRMIFPTVEGCPRLQLLPPWSLTPTRLDLTALDAAAQTVRLEALARAESLRPFDLQAGPLARLFLVELAADRQLLLFSTHQAIADRWSMSLVVRELDRLYRADRAGEPPPTAPVRPGYRDFAAWQHRRLSSLEAEQLPYWKERLTGAPIDLPLPLDRPRAQRFSFRGAREHFVVPSETARALERLARAEGATLSAALLGAYALLLGRYARRDDLVLGLALPLRVRAALEDVMGPFVSPLPARLELAGVPNARALIRRAFDAQLGAHLHHQALQGRIAGETTLFSTLFAFERVPALPPRLGDLDVRWQTPENGHAKLDLALSFEERDGVLHGAFEYATDLFDAATIVRLKDQLGHLLTQLVARPAARVASLALLPADRDRVVRAPAPAPLRGPLQALFAAQVARTPDAIAVTDGARQLSYRELDRRAEALARNLVRLGVGPEQRVGLHVAPSAELIVGLLAILKAGGAYVPVEVGAAAEQLRFVLEDARAMALVTEASRAHSLGPLPCALVTLDGDSAPVDAGAKVAAIGAPTDLAYILYTAGATGRPKGVVVEHGMVANLFAAAAELLTSADPHAVWTLSHSIASDQFVWELWGALLHGGRVVLVPRDVAASPSALHELVAREQVTVLSQTPAELQRLCEAIAERAPLLHLRALFVGGEPFAPRLLAPWIARFGDQQPAIHHAYGHTEATVFTTARRMTRADLDGRPGHFIGSALPGLCAWVLDRELQPLPVGAIGELFIGGASVARGYVHRASETAVRFVPDPFGAPGARLYRTGDLARLLSDGELELLGRTVIT